MEIRERLLTLQEPAYRDFQAKLMPTVSYDAILGIRTPLLRKLAKEIKNTEEAELFLQQLPHFYYEENNLHAFLLEQENDFFTAVHAVDMFLPYVDNWATCDSMSPKVFAKNKEALLPYIDQWLMSTKTYVLRFGIKMLMEHFLNQSFSATYADRVAAVRSEEYYVKMMIAWYFATALAKQYAEVLPYLERHRLEPWVHNKTIQKAVESYRITLEQKAYLRTLRIKT